MRTGWPKKDTSPSDIMRLKRIQWKADGRCIRCGQPNDSPGKCTCTKCAAYRSSVAKLRRELRIRAGRCARCGTPNSNGCIHCDACLLKFKEQYRRKRNRETANAQQ